MSMQQHELAVDNGAAPFALGTQGQVIAKSEVHGWVGHMENGLAEQVPIDGRSLREIAGPTRHLVRAVGRLRLERVQSECDRRSLARPPHVRQLVRSRENWP